MARGESDPTGRLGPGLGVGLAVEDWAGDARFYEYSAAVDPIGSGATTGVPVRHFPSQWHDPSATRVVELDLSDALRTPYPATGPSLLARFVCIAGREAVDLAPKATSVVFYCLRGTAAPTSKARAGPVASRGGRETS